MESVSPKIGSEKGSGMSHDSKRNQGMNSEAYIAAEPSIDALASLPFKS